MASKVTPASKAPVKTSAAKANALSLHIGLNAVDPAAYGGWDGPLAACEFDAKDMAALAKSQGMKPTVLLTKKGTRAATLAAMRSAAKSLKAGDLFLMTYSGHGGQVGDVNGDEPDHKDETLCLYDGQLIDDELYFELSKFAAGVRVLVLSDSCHSGTVTRDFPPPPPPAGQRPRLMPAEVARRVYETHKKFYDDLQRKVLAEAAKTVVDPDAALALVGGASQATALVGKFKPSVVLISGCQDNQTSMDGEHNGAFTGQLLKIWNSGAFSGNYSSFHSRIRAGMPPSQSPNLFLLGDQAALASFMKQKPFTV
ncbi:caspase family protein [Paucibacter sp. Y2R2-4]|uniref:caspase family protein n=1 Tax=Paucibacter sp. Y2R2-4 TaxID=2893553 RepID=UPI0021E4CCF4|nr:caspase family protein [Paucibacter sp. Y2R2-4]MCV2352318.1 caspase family protein [Paucibacter sp. Y2R2-4]